MSRTATIARALHTSNSIILSPSKKLQAQGTKINEPATYDLWKWTFKPEAVAPCFIEDIFKMQYFAEDDVEFFRLGRVPCRSVRVVGLVVGVHVYENRIKYTVDDGTAVVDCLHRQPAFLRAPAKAIHANAGAQVQAARPKLIPQDPTPVACVGIPVTVTGRVVQKYETRELVVDTIVPCPSGNDEPRHWLEVHRLHLEHYSLSTPFSIPESKPSATSTAFSKLPSTKVAPSTPSAGVNHRTPAGTPARTAFSTPSTSSMSPSTSSISTSPAASSPARSAVTSSPQKLRHPSRLHSRDLNDNTFRIYMKHYMDCMFRLKAFPNTEESDNDIDTDTHADQLMTPTISSRYRKYDETPRANSSIQTRTPRPRIPTFRLASSVDDRHSLTKGFTLSYLRRVPVLADLARRIVKAVTKKRQLDEGHKRRVALSTGGGTASSIPSIPSTTPTSSATGSEQLGLKVKRLFRATVIRLLQEGSIILWDGPVYSCDNVTMHQESQMRLWNHQTSTTSTMAVDGTVFSVASSTSIADLHEDLALSDPDDKEESYIPLSPKFLADTIETTLRKICQKNRRGNGGSGVTKGEITAFLKNDDRWQFLSEWSVGEALDVLREEGRARCASKGQWVMNS